MSAIGDETRSSSRHGGKGGEGGGVVKSRQTCVCPKAKFSQDAGRRLAAVDPILRAATRRASGCGFGRVTGCVVSKQLIM